MSADGPLPPQAASALTGGSAPAAHCDPRILAVVALGGDAPSEVFDRHMRSCAACEDRLTHLREIAEATGDSLADRAYAMPPGRVWQLVADGAGDAGSQPDLVIPGVDAPAVIDLTEPSRGHRGVWVAILVLVVLAAIAAGAYFAFG